MECRNRPSRNRRFATAGSRRPRTAEHLAHEFKPEEQAEFDKEITIFSIVGRLPSLTRKAPRLIHQDGKSRKLVLEYPRLHWWPLYRRARACMLHIDTLRQIKTMLCRSIDELYDNNVAYPVRQDNIFLVKRSSKESSRWDFFLGGWQNCSLRNQAEAAEWDKQREAQLNAINVMFKPLEERCMQQVGSEGDHGDLAVE